MAFRIARVGIEDDITVDLAVGGIGSGKGSQHRTIDGSGAVGPGQGIGKVPQNVEGIAPGGAGGDYWHTHSDTCSFTKEIELLLMSFYALWFQKEPVRSAGAI